MTIDKDRRKAVSNLIQWNAPLPELAAGIRKFPWDCDEELVELDQWDIGRALDRFVEGELTAKDIEDWANLIEGRDDIKFASDDVLETIHWLANPYLEGVLTEASANEYLRRLPSYRYSVSLRIWHPTIDPAEITAALGLTPTAACRAGEPRNTPKGRPLKGNWRESYWTARLAEGNARKDDLPSTLTTTLETLLSNRAFFQRIRAEGGVTEFFIGWFMMKSMAGEILESTLLGRMAELGINLSLDLYSREYD